MASTPAISPQDLERILQRARRKDDLGLKVAQALELIEQQLDSLGDEAVAISFNGGKDCTVLLHLFAGVLYKRHSSSAPRASTLLHETSASHSRPDATSHTEASHPISNGHGTGAAITDIATTGASSSRANVPIDGPTHSPPPLPDSSASVHSTHTPPSATHHKPRDASSSMTYPPIKSIYITAPDPFPALETFVLESADRYALDLYRFGGGMKAALEEYLGCSGGKGVKGVLVGTRRGDPNGDVEPLAPTDPSWPQFLRIHPILHWSYSDIWAFLRELDVHWCTLYDQGYTSLGSTKNTVPNPVLRWDDGGWDPAWRLEDGSKERAGRLDSS